MDLGLNNNPNQRGKLLGYYKKNFEDLLIAETKCYYQKESENFLELNTVTAYLVKVSSLLINY